MKIRPFIVTGSASVIIGILFGLAAVVVAYHLHITTVVLSHLLTTTFGGLGIGLIVLGALILAGGYLIAENAGESIFRGRARTDTLDEMTYDQEPAKDRFTVAALHRPRQEEVTGAASVVTAGQQEGVKAAAETEAETAPLVSKPGASV